MLLTDIFSLGGEVVPAGTVSGVRCPHCGRIAEAHIFRVSRTIRAAGLPILRRSRCILLCSSCGAAVCLPVSAKR